MVSTACFLVGAERSGTTLLRLALNAHSQIAWVREFEYSVDMIGEDGTYPELDRYRAWLETHRIFRSSDYEVKSGLDYPHLLQDFLEQQRCRESKPFVGATVHRHFDRLIEIWPDAHFIHLVRDPRDVARSVVKMGWAGNSWTGIEGWLESETLWRRVAKRIHNDRQCELKYEDFAAQPEAALRRITDFLGVTYEPSMLDFHLTTTYSPPDRRFTEQWRHTASRREIAWVETRAASQMDQLGYASSGLIHRSPGLIVRGLLNIQDYYGRVRFRLRRNGLALSVADWVSRVFGIDGWHRKLRHRINEIETQHLM